MKKVIKFIKNRIFMNKFFSCGSNLKVFGKVIVKDPNTISIGQDVKLNDGCKLLGRTGSTITIGDRVTLSSNVTVLSSGYDINEWIINKIKKHVSMNTYIGDDVWICANSTIVGDVKITGKFVVIGAGSVVTEDISESYCLYAGVPAKLIKKYK